MTRLGEGVVLGAMAAVIAPRRENGHTIDISLALDILDFVNDRGVKGAAVLGATGEFIHYDVEERMRLAQMAVRRSRTPVIVNVSHSTVEGAILLARNATEVGATAAFFPAQPGRHHRLLPGVRPPDRRIGSGAALQSAVLHHRHGRRHCLLHSRDRPFRRNQGFERRHRDFRRSA